MVVSAIEFVVGDLVLNAVTTIFEDLTHEVQNGRHTLSRGRVTKGHESKDKKKSD